MKIILVLLKVMEIIGLSVNSHVIGNELYDYNDTYSLIFINK